MKICFYKLHLSESQINPREYFWLVNPNEHLADESWTAHLWRPPLRGTFWESEEPSCEGRTARPQLLGSKLHNIKINPEKCDNMVEKRVLRAAFSYTHTHTQTHEARADGLQRRGLYCMKKEQPFFVHCSFHKLWWSSTVSSLTGGAVFVTTSSLQSSLSTQASHLIGLFVHQYLRRFTVTGSVVFPVQQKWAPITGRPTAFIAYSSEWSWSYHHTRLLLPSQNVWLLRRYVL